jgi:aryl-alcohol dehydrogenase-like predicted oxidoreductase
MTTAQSGSLSVTQLGRTGLDITRVGLGSWAIGGPWRWGWGAQDDEDSIATILRAVDLGVNWIDTAAVYGVGHGEEVIGKALRALPAARRPLVFTKCGVELEDGGEVETVGDAQAIRQGTEQSARRLGVEAIDLMQLHWPPAEDQFEEAWGTLVELRAEGRIRFAGLSNCDVEQLNRAERIGRVDSVQPPLSLVDRGACGEILPWCADHGTGVIVYSPMGAGRLTGRFDAAAVARLSSYDWRRSDAGFSGEPLARTLALVDKLRWFAEELGCSVPELAVAWTLHQRGVSGAIVGARRSEQVDGWIKAGEIPLEPGLLDRIAQALAETGAGTE